jgi:tetratricopeptide (TPR) repeat protein
LGDGEKALEAAQKAIDVFETGHDHRRETFALYEYGRAEILLGKLEDGLSTLDNVLQITADEDAKDFEFIIDIESQMAVVMRELGRIEEADEVERRLASVKEALN